VRPHLSSFLNHVAERSSPVTVPGAKQFFLGSDVVEVFFPRFEDETEAELHDASPDNQDTFFLTLYAAVTSLPKPVFTYLLWVKWGHDDEGNFPPLAPETATEDTEPTQVTRLNPSWDLIQFKFRTEVALRGGGSGGAGNIVFWYAPPTPTLTYPFTGPAPLSGESYGFTPDPEDTTPGPTL
jgi:hypothetical protein